MSLLHCNKKYTIFIIIFISWLLKEYSIESRSVIRKSYKKKPTMYVNWTTQSTANYQAFALTDSKVSVPSKKKNRFISSTQLEIGPMFKTFEKKFFDDHMLPDTISYRYEPHKQVTRQELEKKLENLFKEIYKKERTYSDFDILRKSNFNRRKQAGLLILKFKEYPFVVKVFMENPRNFVKPYSKGLYPIFFFNMGGGINRHLLGFTRVKNLHNIQQILANNPKWNNIETPRKWHWVPKNSKNLEIVGTNFIKDKTIKTIMPGTYCVIADAIKLKHSTFSLFDKEARAKCMSLCNDLGVRIDPHIDNFLLEKDTEKLVIIDTEHFPSIVGLEEDEHFDGYFSWYFRLAKKCVNDMFFKTKKERFEKI